MSRQIFYKIKYQHSENVIFSVRQKFISPTLIKINYFVFYFKKRVLLMSLVIPAEVVNKTRRYLQFTYHINLFLCLHACKTIYSLIKQL